MELQKELIVLIVVVLRPLLSQTTWVVLCGTATKLHAMLRVAIVFTYPLTILEVAS